MVRARYVGEPLAGDDKYQCAAMGKNGKCYAVPWKADRVLEVCPHSGSMRQIGPSLRGCLEKDVGLFDNLILADNGCLYAAPNGARQVLEVDPNFLTVQLIGPELTEDDAEYFGITKAATGKLYAVPHWRHNRRVLEIDPSTHEVRFIGNHLEGVGFVAVQPATNGKLYAAPAMGQSMLEIDPATASVRLIESTNIPVADTEDWLFSDMVAAPNGRLYAAPGSAARVMEFDPATGAVTMIGDRDIEICSLEDDDVVERYQKDSLVLASNGKLYALPDCATEALEIDPVLSTVSFFDPPINKDHSRLWTAAFNGKFYAAPSWDTGLLEFDPTDRSFRFLHCNLPAQREAFTYFAASDRTLVAPPSSCDQALVIDLEAIAEVSEHVQSLRKGACFSDVELVVGETKFPAHKVLLMRIPFFAALLSGEYAEKQGQVEIKDANPDAFEVVLGAIYQEEYHELNLSVEVLRSVLELAHRFEILCLRNWGSTKLAEVLREREKELLTSTTAASWLIFAQRHQAHALAEVCLNFVETNGPEVLLAEALERRDWSRDRETYLCMANAVAGKRRRLSV